MAWDIAYSRNGQSSACRHGLFARLDSHHLFFFIGYQGIYLGNVFICQALNFILEATIIVFGNGLVAQQSLGLVVRSEEHTSELQSRGHLVCRLLLEKKKNK